MQERSLAAQVRKDKVHEKILSIFSVNLDLKSDLTDIFTEYIVWIGEERHFHDFGSVAFVESLYVDNI